MLCQHGRLECWECQLKSEMNPVVLDQIVRQQDEISTLREKLKLAEEALEYEYNYQCMNYNEPNRRLYKALAKIREE